MTLLSNQEFNAERIWRICVSCALSIYGRRPPSPEYADATARLLFGTAAQESGLVWERQRTPRWEGDVGGFSKWQVEKGSIEESMKWLGGKPELSSAVNAWLYADPRSNPLKEGSTPIILWAMRLDDNDKIGCLFARLHYMRVPQPIPDTLRGQADDWKEHYNTVKGKGTVDQYLINWARLCQPTIVRS